MAIDTAEKRRTIAGIPFGWGITPEVAKDSEWRRQVGWSYSIVAAAGLTTAEDRRSAAGIFFLLGPEGVTSNAAKDREWRQQAGYGYSGISAGVGVVVEYRKIITLREDRIDVIKG